jgi:flagellar biosynthesis/type III secretory pathway protein FliH
MDEQREQPRRTGEGAPPVLAPDTPEMRDAVTALAAQVRALGARVTGATTERQDPHVVAAAERMLAAAERAAAQIRESAQREAERIRAAGPPRAHDATGLIVRQRHTLAALAAEIERIEHSAATLRAQLHSLETELANMVEALSRPAASRGTSRRPPA